MRTKEYDDVLVEKDRYRLNYFLGMSSDNAIQSQDK